MLKSLTTLTLQLSLPLAPLTLALPSSSIHPCLGRGELRPRGPLEGRCACARGYGGERCELVIGCPLGCSGRGECEIAADGGGRVCACEDGWRGAACEEARCPADCAGRGRCVDGRCECVAGATGADCRGGACDPACAHGTCNSTTWRCDCAAGWRGAACDEAEAACVAGGCGGAGVCAGGVCRCTGGYFGSRCEQRRCAGACGGHGDCVDGACVCAAGWSGPDCAARDCPGTPPCSALGHCRAGACVCLAGYSGADCSVAPGATVEA